MQRGVMIAEQSTSAAPAKTGAYHWLYPCRGRPLQEVLHSHVLPLCETGACAPPSSGNAPSLGGRPDTGSGPTFAPLAYLDCIGRCGHFPRIVTAGVRDADPQREGARWRRVLLPRPAIGHLDPSLARLHSLEPPMMHPTLPKRIALNVEAAADRDTR